MLDVKPQNGWFSAGYGGKLLYYEESVNTWLD